MRSFWGVFDGNGGETAPRTTSSRSTPACLRRPVWTTACSVCGWCAVHHADIRRVSRYCWICSSKNKSDASDALHFSLRISALTGVECVQSDNGGEFTGGSFTQLCAERAIWQDNTTPETPKLNGVMERGLRLVQEAAHATYLEAPDFFRALQLRSSGRLYAEALYWACDMLDRSPTTANTGKCSPCGFFWRVTPKLRVLAFLRPDTAAFAATTKPRPKPSGAFTWLVGPGIHLTR